MEAEPIYIEKSLGVCRSAVLIPKPPETGRLQQLAPGTALQAGYALTCLLGAGQETPRVRGGGSQAAREVLIIDHRGLPWPSLPPLALEVALQLASPLWLSLASVLPSILAALPLKLFVLPWPLLALAGGLFH